MKYYSKVKIDKFCDRYEVSKEDRVQLFMKLSQCVDSFMNDRIKNRLQSKIYRNLIWRGLSESQQDLILDNFDDGNFIREILYDLLDIRNTPTSFVTKPVIHFEDAIGLKVGKLTILEFFRKGKWGYAYFKCKCDCGNITDVSWNNLKKNYVKSCGCLKKMKISNTNIEILMQNELKKNKINFKTQVEILSYYPDILLTDYNLIIECDGEYWHRNSKAQERDRKRDERIKNKGYTILRFWGNDIENNMEKCIQEIRNKINEIKEG